MKIRFTEKIEIFFLLLSLQQSMLWSASVKPYRPTAVIVLPHSWPRSLMVHCLSCKSSNHLLGGVQMGVIICVTETALASLNSNLLWDEKPENWTEGSTKCNFLFLRTHTRKLTPPVGEQNKDNHRRSTVKSILRQMWFRSSADCTTLAASAARGGSGWRASMAFRPSCLLWLSAAMTWARLRSLQKYVAKVNTSKMR